MSQSTNLIATLRLIAPSTQDYKGALAERIERIRAQGIEVRYHERPLQQDWHYYTDSVAARCSELLDALNEMDTDAVICIKGGYGCSDLLTDFPWHELSASQPKWLVGFSDISALASALYARLGWSSLHGAMPASPHWEQNEGNVLHHLTALKLAGATRASFGVEAVGQAAADSGLVRGKLWGGCLSVLTHLIGTPNFPDITDHILLIEDISEHPARLIRMLRQWQQSRSLAQVRAIVAGDFLDLGEGLADCAPEIYQLLAQAVAPIPFFRCQHFGHGVRNESWVQGAHAVITKGDDIAQRRRLEWSTTPI